MQSEQLGQHYASLRDDLSDAYGQIPWRSEHIDDLANKLRVVEQLMSRDTDDEQCDDGFLSLGPLVRHERPGDRCSGKVSGLRVTTAPSCAFTKGELDGKETQSEAFRELIAEYGQVAAAPSWPEHFEVKGPGVLADAHARR